MTNETGKMIDWREESRRFDGVADVIRKHGGCMEKPYIAALYVAQKAG